MFLWFPRIILTFSEIKCHLLLYFYQHNHRNEVLPQGGPKNKKNKDILISLNRFIVYNSLDINMDLPGVGSK